ncbi:MAG: alkaline phosphatase family protein [Actinocrinis sp.]
MDTGASEGDAGFDYPAYGAGALCDVLPAIGTALGVPGLGGWPEPNGGAKGTRSVGGAGYDGGVPGASYAPDHASVLAERWGISPVGSACLFLVDGMGSELILKNADAAPYLSALLSDSAQTIGPQGTGHTLTAGFPSTTSTSLSSIGTGLPPGVHGMLGYKLAVPGTGRLMNFLKWDQDVDPLVWQPRETMFERMDRAGIAVTHVSSPRFAESGLTRSVFRGARFSGAEPPDVRAERAIAALEAQRRSLVYLYYSDLDFVGHATGAGSQNWRDQLGYVDALVQWLAERLPGDSALYVVADHGMIDVPDERRIDADTDWELRAGVALLGGEPRARHVYAHAGAERDVLAIWSERLDGVAEVRSRAQAIDEGWFGPSFDARMSERIGDVVVAMRGDWAVVATEREVVESRLIGMHGSMTAAEQLVPLLEVRG